MTPTLIIIGALILTALFLIRIYNRLITLRNRYKNAFAQVDVQLKRRHDLIPNLVETAKGYLSHEKDTLERVMAARSGAMSAAALAAKTPGETTPMRELALAEGALTGAVGRLLAVAEAYPDLKGSQPMVQLMEELASTENKVGFARQAFNDAVTTYNTEREKVPAVFVAQLFQFHPAELFEIENKEERSAPSVSFR